MTRGNPNNYPLAPLTAITKERQTLELTLRQRLEEELRQGLAKKDMEFETELLKARQAEVGASELARATGYSRPYVYELLKRAKAAGWHIPDVSVSLPWSNVFTRTSGLTGVHCTPPNPIGTITEFDGYVGYGPAQGWVIVPAREGFNYGQGVAIQAAYQSQVGQLREPLNEWAEAMWPAMKDRPTLEQVTAERDEAKDEPEVPAAEEEEITLEMFDDGDED